MAVNILTARKVICSLLGIGWFIVLPIQAVEAEDRVSFVVGNASYKEEFSLKNPINDALAVSGVLKKFGFETIERNDLRTSQVNELRKSLEDRISRDSILFFFYAGHALQIDGRNYLAPVDANFDTSAAIENESLYLGDILSIIEKRRPKLAVVILDACRDNPFKNEKNASIGKGLARVDPPSSTVIFYATRPGGVASDGSGENGLFTQALLNEVSDPKASLEVLFRRVSTSVYKTSKGEQEPWIEGVIRQEFTIAQLEPGSLPSVSGKIEGDLSISPTLPDAVDKTVLANEAGREELISQAKENLLTVEEATSLVLAETEPELVSLTGDDIMAKIRSLNLAGSEALATQAICDRDGCFDYPSWSSLLSARERLDAVKESLQAFNAATRGVMCELDLDKLDCVNQEPISMLVIYPLAFLHPPKATDGFDLSEVKVTKSGGLSFKFDPRLSRGLPGTCITPDGSLQLGRDRVEFQISRMTCFNVAVPGSVKAGLQVLSMDLNKMELIGVWTWSVVSFLAYGSGQNLVKVKFEKPPNS